MAKQTTDGDSTSDNILDSELKKMKSVILNIAPINDEDWQAISDYRFTIKKYPKGSFFHRAGDISSQIGFILSGSFRWYYIDEKGELRNYHFFLDNFFIVEFYSFIKQQPGNMYIEAMEDSDVILLPKRQDILHLYSMSHNWERFGRIITEQIYIETTTRVHDLLFKSAEERYLDLLMHWPGIFQRVSLSNIASYLGIKVPSLSRIRKRIFVQD